jgi:hypothetical protein
MARRLGWLAAAAILAGCSGDGDAAGVHPQQQAPLAVATRYLAVVRAGLESGGAPVVAPPGFDTAGADAAAAAAALGIATSEVVLALPFTTARVRDELEQAAASLADMVPSAAFSEDRREQPGYELRRRGTRAAAGRGRRCRCRRWR